MEINNIPLVDLKAQYLSIKDEIDSTISKCINDANFIKGKVVTEFENKFAGYIGAEHCIGCGNGTDALELILRALEIGRGDEVIVPALSWIATAEAVNNIGAEPVFVDIKPDDYTIDSTKILKAISSKTKAIIPVHLYGCPCDMDLITSIAEKYNLFIVEDCAQAHGAEFKGKKIGSFGIAAAFSFFPSKNLGAFGDSGAVVTNNQKVADYVRMISNHGQLKERHHHQVIGRNSRLDTIQAAVLNVKIKYLDSWNQKRIEAADYYRQILSKIDHICFSDASSDKKHVYHIFSIRTDNRDDLMRKLNEAGVSTGVHYPKPLPFLEAYKYKEHVKNDFPVASEITSELLSLPVFPEIENIQIEKICSEIVKILVR
jgi:dTDP-4-amino-4,6-dideoxygalactose transaminase